MKLISDLHIHSRFARACSKQINLQKLEQYAKIKGINLLGTGDFAHPTWFSEIKSSLTEDENGILWSNSKFPFVWQTEISLMYSQDGKGRRIHHVILAPNGECVSQFIDVLRKKGRLDYDGRPIFGFSSIELIDLLHEISKDFEVIPAHCLLPNEQIQCNPKLKAISHLKEGDEVLTHKGRFKKVRKIYSRPYDGKVYHVIPRYFSLGLRTTDEHPFYSMKTLKNCSWTKGICKPTSPHINYCVTNACSSYKPEWVSPKNLSKGDVLLYPRLKEIKDRNTLNTAGFKINVDADFCRLIGYYLAEGYTNSRDGFGFAFNEQEKEFIADVIGLTKKYFGLSPKKGKQTGELIFYSKKLMNLFIDNFYSGDPRRANNKILPSWFLYLPAYKQVELFKGWWYGDKGYSSSRELINQMKIICLRLGIIPSIRVDSVDAHKARGKHLINNRRISANYDNYMMDNLTFFEDQFELINDAHFRKFVKRRKFKYGWMDKNWIYLPIRKIKISNYSGPVYNLEVEDDNSYSSEFACVHNCWTPWFGIFGSKSGFDSVEECFKEKSKLIHAFETGMSSDPAMNWRLSRLDKYIPVSFSDMHSFWPWRIGREATVFDVKLSYKELINAIRTRQGIHSTIEVDPNYGKYHVDGHRNCGVTFEPSETRKLKEICPKCKRPLTLGVLYRVEQLADREEGYKPKNAIPFNKLIPLSEIISAVYGASMVSSKKVWEIYNKLIKAFENEYNILLNADQKELSKVIDEKLARVIIQNREEKIKIKPGYDGVYGVPVIDGNEAKIETENKSDEKPVRKQKGLDEFM